MKFFGRPLTGYASENPILPLYFSSQNLNETPSDLAKRRSSGTGPMWRYGRAWLSGTEGHGGLGLRVEWNFLRKNSGRMEVSLDGDEMEITAAFGIPWIASLYLGFENLPKSVFDRLGLGRDASWRDRQRQCGFYWDVSSGFWDSHFVWRFWAREHESGPNDPKWMRSSFFLADEMFGRMDLVRKPLFTERVDVLMPEGPYPATVVFQHSTWSRPRWPFRGVEPLYVERVTFEITPDKPIPEPGKGENSWDCGDDASYSLSGPVPPEHTYSRNAMILHAAQSFASSCMRTRMKRSGTTTFTPSSAPTPAPESSGSPAAAGACCG